MKINEYGQKTLKNIVEQGISSINTSINTSQTSQTRSTNMFQALLNKSINTSINIKTITTVPNVSQTFRKHFANMSENNAKNHYTDPENDIFYLYTYTHAHTTTERL